MVIYGFHEWWLIFKLVFFFVDLWDRYLMLTGVSNWSNHWFQPTTLATLRYQVPKNNFKPQKTTLAVYSLSGFLGPRKVHWVAGAAVARNAPINQCQRVAWPLGEKFRTSKGEGIMSFSKGDDFYDFIWFLHGEITIVGCEMISHGLHLFFCILFCILTWFFHGFSDAFTPLPPSRWPLAAVGNRPRHLWWCPCEAWQRLSSPHGKNVFTTFRDSFVCFLLLWFVWCCLVQRHPLLSEVAVFCWDWHGQSEIWKTLKTWGLNQWWISWVLKIRGFAAMGVPQKVILHHCAHWLPLIHDMCIYIYV